MKTGDDHRKEDLSDRNHFVQQEGEYRCTKHQRGLMEKKKMLLGNFCICEKEYPYRIDKAPSEENIEKRILEYIRKYPCCLTVDIAEGLNISYMTAKRRVTDLKEKGIITKENERWIIREKEDIQTDNTLHDTFEVAVVMKMESHPEITIEDIAEELYLSPTTVRRTIKSLQNRGIITRTGSARKGRWVVSEYKLKN